MFRACSSVARVASTLVSRTPTIRRQLPIMAQAARNYSDANPIIFNITNADEFHDQVLNSELPVIVDFHADWCGPCQMLGPRLEQKVNGRDGQVVMAKVDIDAAGELATDWNVTAVPTVLAFNKGEVTFGFQGNVDDADLDRFLDQAIEAHEQ